MAATLNVCRLKEMATASRGESLNICDSDYPRCEYLISPVLCFLRALVRATCAHDEMTKDEEDKACRELRNLLSAWVRRSALQTFDPESLRGYWLEAFGSSREDKPPQSMETMVAQLADHVGKDKEYFTGIGVAAARVFFKESNQHIRIWTPCYQSSYAFNEGERETVDLGGGGLNRWTHLVEVGGYDVGLATSALGMIDLLLDATHYTCLLGVSKTFRGRGGDGTGGGNTAHPGIIM